MPRAPRPTRAWLKPGHGVTTLGHLRHQQKGRTMTGTDLMPTSVPGGHPSVAEGGETLEAEHAGGREGNEWAAAGSSLP